jgi:DNA-binding NtrC family response regulator
VSRRLARRSDWLHAARGELTLGASLLKRGRPREARVVLAEARRHATNAGDDLQAFEAAVVMGAAWMDSGELDQASATLHAAVAAGRQLATPLAQATARLALARCQFWRGQYQEAEETTLSIDPSGLPLDLATRVSVCRARVALGRADLACATNQASTALDAARNRGDQAGIAAAAYGLALVQLVLGDRDGVERHSAVAIAAARATHDPLRALKARLLAVESARRVGRNGPAAALLARIRSLRTCELPCTIKARTALLSDLLRPRDARDALAQHVARSGLAALSLFAPAAAAAPPAHVPGADDVLEILQLCQAAADDRGAVVAVCQRLRVRLRASAVAVFTRAEGRHISLAADGGRHGAAMAARVFAAGQLLPPHGVEDGIEGGAPIRYGGEVVGVLVGRWTLGAPPDAARASMALLTSATALCPAVAAMLAERAARPLADAHELLGVSSQMLELRRSVDRAAAAPFPILIEGESGAGKELVARALHRRSARRDRAMTALNCAALPDDLAESELFGHARGAFTGAAGERQGVFEQAHGSTLFLDEIGELSLRAQAKMLRAIQEGEIRRLGENVPRRVDVRLVAATNRDLRQEVSAGRFRLDLLYRLDVIRIQLPPLRSRRDDIAVLVDHFWREATARVGSRATLASATVALLARYDWPGNVRELQNVLAALAVRAPKRGVIPPTSLPPPIGGAVATDTWRLDAARRGFEERFVRAALVRTAGHRGRAAKELGVTRQGLSKLLVRLGIAEGSAS